MRNTRNIRSEGFLILRKTEEMKSKVPNIIMNVVDIFTDIS